ncbi:M14 family metallopeptidase [Acidobacteriota bacterium]
MMKKTNIAVLIAVLILSLGIFSPQQMQAAKVKLSFDHFYDNAELTEALKALEEAYPEFMEVKSLGKTYQEREIWSVILNNPSTGLAEHKPGYYIDGNIHGNEIQGTEVALYAIWYLLENYGKTDLATRLLDEKAFYIIPTMNPDAREYFINEEDYYRSGLIPLDDDRDGVSDEDPAEDLNGDGFITQMRKKDPDGIYRLHPEDSRILIPVGPGEEGEYSLLGEEGIDNDGDGRINEDGLGGYDMNRNYGFNWQPNYVQQGSGEYPFCFPETIATRDFILDHPNIMGAQNFHNTGGMILRPPGAKNMGDLPMGDRTIYDYIGNNGEKILPGYRYIIIYKDLYTVYGGSIDFFVNILGAFTFSNELDMSPTFSFPIGDEEGTTAEQDPEMIRMRAILDQVRQMEYHDLILLGEHYRNWTTFTHPFYGEVEIGGMTKFGSRVPPLFQLPDTCHRNAAFVFYHADQLPRLNFKDVQVTKIDKDLYQIDVTINNSRVTPTISSLAVQKKLHRADLFKIDGTARLRAAGLLTDKYRGITQKIETRDDRIWLPSGVASFGTINLRLLVKGKDEIELIYDSLKGGYYTTTATLK